jgi:oligoribonuclease NrnB/cAMP/cGMP phosphodiesterase (DHH superfamily)
MSTLIQRAIAVLSPPAIDTVIYHKQCADGLTAAWAAYRIGRNKRHWPGRIVDRVIAATYDPALDVDALVERVRDRYVLVVDFSYPLAVHRRLREAAAGFLVLDHHASAQRELQGEADALFDTARSGAALAWQYFKGRDNAPLPPVVAYVQDRDLWRWEMPQSREFSAAYALLLNETLDGGADDFATFGKTMYAIEQLHKRSSGGAATADALSSFIESGAMVRKYEQAHVARVLRDRSAVGRRTLGGGTVRAVVLNSTVLVSELGNALCTAHPDADVAIIWWYDAAQRRFSVSARSDRALHPAVDCSVLARQFGGGGHPQAAGWKWPHSDIETMFDAPAAPALSE